MPLVSIWAALLSKMIFSILYKMNVCSQCVYEHISTNIQKYICIQVIYALLN